MVQIFSILFELECSSKQHVASCLQHIIFVVNFLINIFTADLNNEKTIVSLFFQMFEVKETFGMSYYLELHKSMAHKCKFL